MEENGCTTPYFHHPCYIIMSRYVPLGYVYTKKKGIPAKGGGSMHIYPKKQ